MVSGQMCGKMFSDMGAEGTKIEAPHRGGPAPASFPVSQRRTASRKETVPLPQYRREGLLWKIRSLHFAKCPPKCKGGRMFTGAVGTWCQAGAKPARRIISAGKNLVVRCAGKARWKVTCGKRRGSSSSTLRSSWTSDHVDSDEPAFKHAAISSGVRRKSSCAGPSKTRV
jgi:hypothetical protein